MAWVPYGDLGMYDTDTGALAFEGAGGQWYDYYSGQPISNPTGTSGTADFDAQVEQMGKLITQYAPLLQSGNITSDQLTEYTNALSGFNELQSKVAQKVLNAGAGYVMSPAEYSMIFAKPYNGEDLASITSGWTTAQQQSIESQNSNFWNHGFPVALTGAALGGVTALAGGGGLLGAAETIPELGLIANPATAEAAIAAGIPSSMLSGGTGALTLPSLSSTTSGEVGPAIGGGEVGDASGFYNDMGATTLEGGVGPSFDTGAGGTGMTVSDGNTLWWGDPNDPMRHFASDWGPLNDPNIGPIDTGGFTNIATDSAALFPGVTEFLKANPWAMPLASTLAGGILGGTTAGQPQSATTSTTTAAPPSQVAGVLSGAASLLPGAGGASAGGSLAGAPNNLGLAGQSLAETMLGNFMLPSTWNPYGGQTTQVPTNPYYGQNNPYLQGVIDRSAGDVTSRIQSQFNRPGGYGGSANQEILARELGNLNNQIRYQDYGLQANLGEQDVNRRLSTSLADIMRNAGLWQNDMARNTANYQAERGRQLTSALGAPAFATGVTESQFAPYANYANLFKGWGSNQSTQYPAGSTAQGALGGALAGYSLSRMFGGG